MAILTWRCVHGAGEKNVVETRNPLSKRKSVGWELFISPVPRTIHPVAKLLKTSTGRVAQIFGAQKSKREHRAARAACPRTTRYIQQHRPDLREDNALGVPNQSRYIVTIGTRHMGTTGRARAETNAPTNINKPSRASAIAQSALVGNAYLELPRRSPPAQRPRAR